jgi:hypothetical protein
MQPPRKNVVRKHNQHGVYPSLAFWQAEVRGLIAGQAGTRRQLRAQTAQQRPEKLAIRLFRMPP